MRTVMRQTMMTHPILQVNPTVLIHENGYATDNDDPSNPASYLDTKRIEFIHNNIQSLLESIRNGSNLKGYFVWSFLDCFLSHSVGTLRNLVLLELISRILIERDIRGCHLTERIVVFTTKHVDKLDSALIRRGCMDMHIELSYCSYEGFKVLAKNYLHIDSHPMFNEIGELLKTKNITPADVAEVLICNTTESMVSRATERLEELVAVLKKAAQYFLKY
ncbi:Aaa-atpase [Thalictrum thalictroides]|uniref:Aaa-atpase n=1 Tax=Thalictrum thalictroides TaxID=46969 RepID=A0A7J6VZQ0_THATH|nr:Aaa-atpase [Thalictrum thalictroides]